MNPNRTNYPNFATLEEGCKHARQVLERKTATNEELKAAALELNKAVRTLRSWLNRRADNIRTLKISYGELRARLRQYDESATTTDKG